MKATLDRFEANFAALRTWAEEGKPLPFFNEGHDFVVGPPMEETDLHAIELKYEVTLPPEYRSFLTRFGDTSIGPGNVFRRASEGLTSRSKNRFPLSAPFLGCCSPSHQQLSNDRQWEEYGQLLKQWNPIPKEDGVLAINAYGCGIDGVLILNGQYCGKVWIQQRDTAYYGPSAGTKRSMTNPLPTIGRRRSIPATTRFLSGMRVG
jgi:hypothetical protein